MVDHRVRDGLLIRSDAVRGFVAAVVVAGIVFGAVIGFLTLANTNTTVNDLKGASQEHGQTLSRIDRVTNRVNHVASVDQAELNQLKKATQTVDAILYEAGMVSSQIKSDLAALCSVAKANC